MAANRRVQRTNTYRTHGSVAYAPTYDRNAVRAPGREQVVQPKPRVRPKEKALTRTQVQIRQAGQVSPFAVVGFLLVGVFAALLLMSYTQYTVVADEVVSLRSELGTMQTENATLTARYEQVFDLEQIQSVVGGTMVRPSASQIEYIDLSEPDSVELYAGNGGSSGVMGILTGVGEVISDVVEYFR